MCEQTPHGYSRHGSLLVAVGALVPGFLAFARDLLVQPFPVLCGRVLRVVVDLDADDAWALRLVIRVVELAHIRVPQCLLRGNALVGVELQAHPQEVQCLGTGGREHLGQGLGSRRWQRLKHSGREGGAHRRGVLGRRATGDLQDAVELVHGGHAREDGLPHQHLAQDAAQGPHVDTLVVARGAQQDLRCTVPTRGDVVRQHGAASGGRLGQRTAQAEVTQLHVAVGVEEQVGGLDVPVEQLCSVHVVQRLQQLVAHILLVDVLQDVGADDVVQIRFHIVEHKVDVLVVLRTDNVQQPDDVVVATELLEVHDLTERALGVRGVAEGVEALLERYRVAGTAVHGFPHNAVGPLAQLL
mmetsp:Transcript_53348/g.108529  ORF Transcript_53348/g.108529 Transcript_53348/m.108529 type:complete len:356 (+) Transcript_53348:57-1124(+)